MPNISWNGGSGNWTDEDNWTPQQVPGSSDTATISGSAASDVLVGMSDSVTASGLVLDDALGTVEVDGFLSAAEITLTSGLLVDAGTIANATVIMSGGSLDVTDGVLQADTIEGPLTIGDGDTVVLQDGFTVVNADGTPGTIALTGADATLEVADAETLDNATITMGNAGDLDTLQVDNVLTLGQGILLQTAGSITTDMITGAGTVINDGSLLVDGSSGTVVLETTDFDNNGSMTVNGGQDLEIEVFGTFDNSGLLAISNGSTVSELDASAFLNTGSIRIGTGSEFDLYNYAPDMSQGQTVGGTVEIDGLLDAGGNTIDVDATGAFSELDNFGTLANATIVMDGGVLGLGTSTFQDDTIEGPLTIGDGDTIVLQDGFTVVNADGTPGTIALTGADATLEVADVETLDNATITMGNAGDLDTLQVDNVLTLGQGILLQTAGSITTDMITGAGTVINNGSLLADGSSGTVVLETTDFDNNGGLTVNGGQNLEIEVFGTFDNSGLLAISNGSTVSELDASAFLNTGSIRIGTGSEFDLYNYAPDMSQGQTVGGTVEIDGLLDAGGNTIDVDATGAFSELDNFGTLANATIVMDGGVLGLGTSTFQDDTIEGPLTIGDGDTIVLQDGFAITGADGTSAGTIALTGADSTLEIADDETLNATSITIGSADDVSTLQVDSTLTLGSGSIIETAPSIVSDAITGAGTVINDGTILAAAAGGNLVIGTTDFTNAGQVAVTNGGSLQIQTFDTFANAGTLSVTSGGLATVESVVTAFSNTGIMVVNGGSLVVDAELQGSGGVTSLSDDGQVELGASASSGQSFDFTDGTGQLVLDDAADFGSLVSGFQQGDSIVMTGFGGASETYADGVVTITQSSTALGIPITTVATIQMEGNYQASDFATSTDSNGDLVLTTDVLPCFAAGTHILTTAGEVAVERLKAGDGVVTVTDDKRRVTTIVWVGFRAVDISRHSAPEKVRPVRVQRGAFGPKQPKRDLLLSPDHAIYVEGALVPVKYLINGTTVKVDEKISRVVYYHVQLQQHEVLLSEGLPTESYLESGGRGMFANSGEPIVLHPDFSDIAWDVLGCAPLKVTGPEVERIRARLADRAASPARRVRRSRQVRVA